MAAETVNVPIHIIPEILQRNLAKDFMQLLTMKATEGRYLVSSYRPALLFRFVSRGWLKFHDGKYYQVTTEEMFPLSGMFTHAKISVDCLNDVKLFKAMLFVMGYLYLMSPQTQRRYCSQRGSRQVNESKHIGGISHTLCMLFFGFSKTWCSKMRKRCEALGLASWTRRWVPLVAHPEFGLGGEFADQMAEGSRGKYRVIDGDIQEEVTARFESACGISLCIPYKYRSAVRKLYA